MRWGTRDMYVDLGASLLLAAIKEKVTEEGIAGDFLTAGIPKEKIVLGFYSPEKRKITDFALC